MKSDKTAEELMSCITCKGTKIQTITSSEYGSTEPPSITEIECCTCDGHGEITKTYAKEFLKVWGNDNWCADKTHHGTKHIRKQGQDYYYCIQCNKLQQIG